MRKWARLTRWSLDVRAPKKRRKMAHLSTCLVESCISTDRVLVEPILHTTVQGTSESEVNRTCFLP